MNNQVIQQKVMVFIVILIIIVGFLGFTGGYVLSYRESHEYAKNYIDYHCGGLNYESISSQNFTFNAKET